MKAKKSGHIKRARAHTTHKKIVRRRPIHKRVMLHPITAFLLLCVGVLVAGSTFRSEAATYDVTAKVPAPALTSPAAIASPSDQAHVTTSIVTIEGTCPSDSYVNLYRDDVFSGSDVCSGGLFRIQTSLSLGLNELQTRVYNFTDDEGPAAPLAHIYYDLPSEVVPPIVAPTSLQLSDVEQVPPEQGGIQEISANPTISGLAPPFSEVVVTFFSDPSVCRTKADSRGVWTCTLPMSLPPGIHHVVIEATTPAGKKLILPTFQVRVVEYVRPFVITSDYKYKSHGQGQSVDWKLGLSGGTAPYELLVDWGDGTSSRIPRPDQAEFTITHTYKTTTIDGTYAVLITVTDARGATTMLQLAAVLNGGVVAAGTGPLRGLTEALRHWLWVVWPAYIAVVLMVVSFWIGEREAYQQFVARRRVGRVHSGRR